MRAVVVRVATRVGLPATVLNAFGYVVATAATGGIAFITVPLLTRALGLDEYGRWALIEPVLLLSSQCASLGIPHWIIKAIAQDRRSPATVFASMTGAALPVGLLVCAGAAAFVMRFGLGWSSALWFTAWAAVEMVLGLALATLRGADRPTAYGVVTVAKAVTLATLLAAGTLHWLELTRAETLLQWSAIASATAIVIAITAVSGLREARHEPLRPRAREYVSAVGYGVPILISVLLLQASTFFERYYIATILDRAAVGSFVVHAKVASVAQLILTAPLALWWPTARFHHLADPDRGDAFFRTTSQAVLLLYLAVASLLWFCAKPLVGWFAPDVVFQPWLVAGHLVTMVCVGMTNPLNVGLLDAGRTHFNLYGIACGVAVQVSLNLLLVPWVGATGAAWAAAGGAFAAMAILNYLSQCKHPVRFPYARLTAYTIGAAASCVAVAWLLPPVWPLRALAFASLIGIVYTWRRRG